MLTVATGAVPPLPAQGAPRFSLATIDDLILVVHVIGVLFHGCWASRKGNGVAVTRPASQVP